MKALVIQNSSDTPIGLVGPILEQKFGIELKVIDAAKADFDRIQPEDFDLFVILGAPQGVYQREIRWIDAELNFTKRLLEAARPVFGICFGGQMIAAALGANVEPMGERHHGWIQNDWAVNECWAGPWFRWHGDSFQLPNGAVPLASSGSVVQGFQYGKAVAVQFHPEADHQIVANWVRNDGSQLVEAGVNLSEFLAETKSQERGVDARLRLLLEDVLERCLAESVNS